MRHVYLALAALLLLSSGAQAQTTVWPCFGTSQTDCNNNRISSGNPLPVTGSFTPVGTQNVNLTQILGSAVSLTNPLFVSPATGATFTVTGAGGTFPATQSTSPWVVSLNATPSIANGNGVIAAPTANAADGIAPVVCGSAVSSCVLKASAGNLYSVYAECSAACWLMVFNATSAPSNGSTTAGIAANNMVECVAIQAGGNGSISNNGMPPSVYTTGITAIISSTTCATLTLATTGFINGKVK